MDAKELAKTFKKGSPEWKLCFRWSCYVGLERRKLRGTEAHSFNKGTATSLVFNVSRCILMGTLGDYRRILSSGSWHMETTSVLVRFWDKFCETEKLLIAEVILSR